jgi:hypothetical protein
MPGPGSQTYSLDDRARRRIMRRASVDGQRAEAMDWRRWSRGSFDRMVGVRHHVLDRLRLSEEVRRERGNPLED